jgi:pimeloyl-ACP methyl ester carboxylesterase
MIPAVLAKSGYVVVVPRHDALLPNDAGSPAIANALSFIDWVRNGWEHRQWVDKRAEATAVTGHSYGALLAARVAQARPAISAYVGLSGPWHDLRDRISVVQSIGAPSFFTWATGDALRAVFENMDELGLWNQISTPKHAAVFPGEHFDYLRPWTGCNFARGDCTLIESVIAELTALFISRHVPLNMSNAHIPLTLDPPNVILTQKQEFFLGGQFSGLKQIKTQSGCSVALRWVDGSQAESRKLGP